MGNRILTVGKQPAKTPNPMKTLIITSGLLLGLLSLQVQAALNINDPDISGGHYMYNLTYSDMNNSTKFDNDVFSQLRMEVVQEGVANPNYLSPIRSDNSGYTTAQFIYKFDFSLTSYLPTSVDIFDHQVAVWPDGGPHETLTSSYSTDGVNYTPIRTLSTDGATSFEFLTSSGTTTIDLSSANTQVLYYKETFVADDLTFGFGWNGAQWNRSASDSDPTFTANFTVAAVPEPSALWLIVGGLMALVAVKRVSFQRVHVGLQK